MKLLSGLLFATSVISANYWRNATCSWRRTLDLVFSKISFVIFFYNGIIYVKKIEHKIVGYTGTIFVLYCYYQSANLLQRKDENWWKYHFLFHVIIAMEQMLVLYGILYE